MTAKEFLKKENITTELVEQFTNRTGFDPIYLTEVLEKYHTEQIEQLKDKEVRIIIEVKKEDRVQFDSGFSIKL